MYSLLLGNHFVVIPDLPIIRLHQFFLHLDRIQQPRYLGIVVRYVVEILQLRPLEVLQEHIVFPFDLLHLLLTQLPRVFLLLL